MVYFTYYLKARAQAKSRRPFKTTSHIGLKGQQQINQMLSNCKGSGNVIGCAIA